MVNSLKTATLRLVRKEFSEHLGKFYWKPVFTAEVIVWLVVEVRLSPPPKLIRFGSLDLDGALGAIG